MSARADTDANELVAGDEALTSPFSPAFTYPIFGEPEKIFGYKGLQIDVSWPARLEVQLISQLSFASGSLKQCLDISFDEKLESEATPADDIETMMYSFIPPDYTKSTVAFDQTVEADAEAFKPMGERLSSYMMSSSAGNAKGKGKAKTNGAARIVEGAEDASDISYEVYRVSQMSLAE